MTTRAVIYARVSGDDRGKEGRNLDSQLAMGREYAAERGYLVVAELPEDERGASGADIDLPQLTKLRDMAHAGTFEILIVREIDRLSRNLAKQLIVEQELDRNGVHVEYVIGEYPDNAEGRLNKHIKASIAEYEREKITERAARGRRQKAKSGSVVMHGRPPYGYRLADITDSHLIVHQVDGTEKMVPRDPDDGLQAGKRLPVPHEPEAKTVRRIFEWYTVGDGEHGPLSMRGIARKLTKRKVPTWSDIWHGADRSLGLPKRTRYGVWSPSSIGRILANETYVGRWYYGKQEILVPVPSLLSEEIWERAEHRRRYNKQNTRHHSKYPYLLNRRVICGECGCKMDAHTYKGGRYKYYRCKVHYDQARTVECSLTRMFRADDVDSAVWSWIQSLLADSRALTEGLESQEAERKRVNAELEEQLAAVNTQLEQVDTRLERVLELHLAGSFPERVLNRKKDELESRTAELEVQQERIRAKLSPATFTDKQIRTIEDFAAQIQEGLAIADQDIEKKRRVVEVLDVKVTLAREDDQTIAYAECNIGQAALSVMSTSTRRAVLRRSHLPRLPWQPDLGEHHWYEAWIPAP